MSKYKCAKCDNKDATRLELMDLADKGMAYLPLCDDHESNIADESKRDSIPLPTVEK